MMGASPIPRALVMELGDPEEEELMMSQKRKGLSR
jgi:hypothetical protein